MPPIHNLVDLEREVAALGRETLMRRYHECVRGGHVWQTLAGQPAGSSHTEWCRWCLRVRAAGFEGWTGLPEILPSSGESR